MGGVVLACFRPIVAAALLVLMSALPARADVTISVATSIDITRDKVIAANISAILPDLSALAPAIVGTGIAANESQNNDSFIGAVGAASFLALIDGGYNGAGTPADVLQSEGFLINQANEALVEIHTPAISEISSTQILTNNDLTIGGGETREASIVGSFNNNSANILVDQSAGIVGNQLNLNALALSPAGSSALSSSQMDQINAGNQFAVTDPPGGPHSARIRGSINGNTSAVSGPFFPVIGVNQSAGIGTNQSNNVSQSIAFGP